MVYIMYWVVACDFATCSNTSPPPAVERTEHVICSFPLRLKSKSSQHNRTCWNEQQLQNERYDSFSNSCWYASSVINTSTATKPNKRKKEPGVNTEIKNKKCDTVRRKRLLRRRYY